MEKNRSSLQERFGKILSISTQKGDNAPRISKSNSRRKSVGDPTDANSSGRTHSGKRTIRTVTNFKDLYELGKEVMPSTHKYMKVLFANRKADNHECVVKVRFKPDCFRSRPVGTIPAFPAIVVTIKSYGTIFDTVGHVRLQQSGCPK